jgi:hypothetical protein
VNSIETVGSRQYRQGTLTKLRPRFIERQERENEMETPANETEWKFHLLIDHA